MSIRPDYDCPPLINYSEMYWQMFKQALPDSGEATKSIEAIMQEHINNDFFDNSFTDITP